jgi:hypothetical protein
MREIPDQKPVPLALDLIRTDDGTQARVCLNDDVVAEYAEADAAGADFPPGVVFHDGSDYWLADGFHRKAARQRNRRKDMLALVRPGTRRDAILYAAGANACHGLRRSNDDKRIAVRRLLTDDEWSQWSDREIARRCGVSDRFVNGVRAELSANRSQMGGAPQAERTVQRGGSLFSMNTSAIGKGKAPEGAEKPSRTAGEGGAEDEDDPGDDDDEEGLEEELDEDEQVLKRKGQVRRLCAKLDRHAQALGLTTERLVQMYRNGELEPAVLAMKSRAVTD